MYTYVQELYIYQYWFVVNWSPLQNINVDIFLVYVEHKRNNLWYLWMEFAGRYVNRRMTSTCFPWMPTLKSQTQIPWLNSSNKTGTESYRHDCMLSLVPKLKSYVCKYFESIHCRSCNFCRLHMKYPVHSEGDGCPISFYIYIIYTNT